MPTSQLIVIVLSLLAGFLAGLGVLYRMSMEQTRLWKRYVEVKMQLQREQALRERQQAEQRKVARPMSSAGPAAGSGDVEDLPVIGATGAA